MTTRTTYNSGSGVFTGSAFADNLDGHIERLYNASVLRLTSLGGTAAAITATVDPTLEAGLVAGMAFWWTAEDDHPAGVTIAINGEAAVDVLDSAGVGVETGDIITDTTYLLFYDGTGLRVVSASAAAADRSTIFQIDTHTASGTSTKPTDFPDDGVVLLEVWAGGGGGASSSASGGGGGGYSYRFISGIDHSTTETVTIGAGGTPGVAGGNSSIGSLIAAFGGGYGVSSLGGGGGGQRSAGGNGGGAGGSPFGGIALIVTGNGNGGNAGGGGYQTGNGGDGIYGGGGGGGGTSSTGGHSLYGGGGGGNTGGTSVFGGNGGNSGAGGTIPGGGGGRNGGAGARGEARVRWIG